MTPTETTQLIDRHIEGWIGGDADSPTLRDRIAAMIAEAEAGRDKLWRDGAETLKHERDEAIKAAHLAVEEGAKDKARLDWLERWMLSLARLTSPDMSGIRFSGQYHNPAKESGEAGPSYLRLQGQTIRDSIDGAMQP